MGRIGRAGHAAPWRARSEAGAATASFVIVFPVLVVMFIYEPVITFTIGENLQLDATARRVVFENCGVDATPDALRMCRPSEDAEENPYPELGPEVQS